MTKPKPKVESIAASRIDLAFACSGSMLPIDEPHNPHIPASRLGTAVHDGMARVALGEPVDAPALSAAYDVDVKELEILINFGRQAIESIREPLRNSKTEIDLSSGNIRCRLDLCAVEMTPAGPTAIAITDWKSGRLMDPKPGQLLANAVAARRRYGMPSCGYIYTGEVWLREREIIERRPDAARLDAFEERLSQTLKYAGRSYSPGEHCGFCPHAVTCQPRVDYIRATAQALMARTILDVSPTVVADLWPGTRALKRAIADYESVANQLISEHGRIGLSDGSHIEFRQKTKSKIDPKKAWPVMVAAGLTENDIAGILSVGKGALIDAVRAKVPSGAKRGAKKAAEISVLGALREAKAISTSHYNEKNHVRVKS